MDALIPSVSIDALLLKRDAMVERLRTAHTALQEVRVLEEALFNGDANHRCSRMRLEDRTINADFTDVKSLPRFIRGVDAGIWDWMLDKSGLWTFMDNEARNAWKNSIHDGNVPEFTRSNVEATFAELYAKRGDMLERGVVAMFRHLSWSYKTNQPHKLGKRLVLTRAVSVYGTARNYASVEHEAANRLDDMVRVFMILDGKPEPDHRNGTWHVLNDAKWPLQTKDVELHGMVRVRGFLNGNAHLTFLRPDLVDHCNRIIAKHHPNALPPAH